MSVLRSLFIGRRAGGLATTSAATVVTAAAAKYTLDITRDSYGHFSEFALMSVRPYNLSQEEAMWKWQPYVSREADLTEDRPLVPMAPSFSCADDIVVQGINAKNSIEIKALGIDVNRVASALFAAAKYKDVSKVEHVVILSPVQVPGRRNLIVMRRENAQKVPDVELGTTLVLKLDDRQLFSSTVQPSRLSQAGRRLSVVDLMRA